MILQPDCALSWRKMSVRHRIIERWLLCLSNIAGLTHLNACQTKSVTGVQTLKFGKLHTHNPLKS